MEENVALDSSKQKQFVKSVKGIKKLIKKNDGKPLLKEKKTKEGKIKKKKRGLVYLSHIPHGFYEHEMTQYFKQFGAVTNARVIRSPKTGRSKGYAFVEFKEPAVAQIVAETMNNYLMGTRLIKAVYIPPNKIRRNALRKKWDPVNNPGNQTRIKLKKSFNTNKDEKGDLKRARKLLANLKKTKDKLQNLGINYDFFSPVDYPEALNNTPEVKQEDGEKLKTKTTNVKSKKSKNKNLDESTDTDTGTHIMQSIKLEKQNKQSVENKTEKSDTKQNVKNATTSKRDKATNKAQMETKGNKDNINNKNESEKEVHEDKVNAQKVKNNQLKQAGVKPMQDFIKVAGDASDSEDSLEFDPDEYEKMFENSGFESDEGSEVVEEESDDEDGSEENEEETESADESEAEDTTHKKGKHALKPVPPVQSKQLFGKQNQKSKTPQVLNPNASNNKSQKAQAKNQNIQGKNQTDLHGEKNIVNQKNQKTQQGAQIKQNFQEKKRKAQLLNIAPKKPKFEKADGQNALKIQYKKKK